MAFQYSRSSSRVSSRSSSQHSVVSEHEEIEAGYSSGRFAWPHPLVNHYMHPASDNSGAFTITCSWLFEQIYRGVSYGEKIVQHSCLKLSKQTWLLRKFISFENVLLKACLVFLFMFKYIFWSCSVFKKNKEATIAQFIQPSYTCTNWNPLFQECTFEADRWLLEAQVKYLFYWVRWHL